MYIKEFYTKITADMLINIAKNNNLYSNEFEKEIRKYKDVDFFDFYYNKDNKCCECKLSYEDNTILSESKYHDIVRKIFEIIEFELSFIEIEKNHTFVYIRENEFGFYKFNIESKFGNIVLYDLIYKFLPFSN